MSTTSIPSKKILAGNWKMHKTRSEMLNFFTAIDRKLAGSSIKKIIAPSPTLLESAVNAAKDTGIKIYSQNCAYAKEGALTGEISPLQLRDIGVTGTLIGHSERRQFFGESTEVCAKRIQTSLENGLEVIYCIGETHKDRQAARTRDVLEAQLHAVTQVRPSQSDPASFVIAYEPVWAIGTGLNAGPEQISEAHGWIREILTSTGLAYPILYGGSVKPANFKQISSIPNVWGGLVGGASLEADSFIELHNELM